MNIKWAVPAVILLITIVLCYILSCEVEQFTVKKYTVKFDECPTGYTKSPIMKDLCQSATDQTKVCTTDKKRWLDFPVCQASTTGTVSSADLPSVSTKAMETFEDFYFTELTPSESLNTAGMYSPLDFSGDSGLPKTTLTKKRPENAVKLYNNLLIAPSKSSDFAAFIKDNRPYLVTPPSRFADYEDYLIAIGDDYTKLSTSLPQSSSLTDKFPLIQDQQWYLESKMNPFYEYNYKILTTEENRVYSFVFKGRLYVFWADSCPVNTIKPIVIAQNDPIYGLVPVSRTFHHFPAAYKQPWFSRYLKNCEQNDKY